MKRLLIPFLFVCLIGIFYYPTIFWGKIPFPGDLLISHYKPWQSYSFLGYNPGSYPTKDQFFDAIRQLYPWKTLTVALVKKGVLPLWNPHNFSGSPLLANNQSAIFYPLSFLYLLASQPVAWSLLVMLQHVMAGIFTYIYCRKLKYSKEAAFFSSIAFSFCLFITGISQYIVIGHTIAWFPLMLWTFEALREEKAKIWISMWILYGTTISMIFAGHLQTAAVIVAVSIVYAFFRTKADQKRSYKPFILFSLTIFTALATTSIQLLPTFELMSLSARTVHDPMYLQTSLLLQPYQLLLFLIPDLFGNPATKNYLINDTYATNTVALGIVPLLFALVALFGKVWRQEGGKIAISMIMGTLLFTLRSPLSELIYRLPIPIITSSSPSNMLFIVTFFVSILAGLGFDRWQKKENFPTLPAACILIALVLGFLLPAVGIAVSYKNLLYSAGVTGLVLGLLVISKYFKRTKSGVVIVLFIVTIFDLFYFFTKFTPFVPQTFIYPQTGVIDWLSTHAGKDRFWGYGSAAIEANIATQFRLYSPDGYDPLYPKRYGEFLGASSHGTIDTSFSRTNRSDAVISPGYGELDFPSNIYRQKILNLLGVKYILDRTENGNSAKTFPPLQYPPVYHDNGWIIYENTQALPRVMLANTYSVFNSNKQFEELFFDPNFSPKKTILLEQEISAVCCNASEGTAAINAYEANTVSIKTQSNGSQLLFLSDTYYPGWHAYIDQIQTDILRADYTFRAVVVPEGNHTVTFEYQPESFSLGLKITMISAGLFFIVFLFTKNKRI